MASRKQPAKKATAKPVKTPADSGDIVDEQLARYREMRDFDVTAEPAGKAKKAAKTAALPFVIQKHAASHLHYDFRLGWNGVLKSWAVAKGPSYVVKDRRLAVQVEDHPMEYGGFEGIIPKGQYGGGTVMVWDQGTWAPQPGHEDVDAGLRDGALKFTLDGTKMHGKWTLIRMNDHGGTGRWKSSGKPNWLLIKEHDDFERSPEDAWVTDDSPDSAVTGRSLEQIAAEEDHIWNSKETAKPGQAWERKTSAKGAATPVAAETPALARTVAATKGKSQTAQHTAAPGATGAPPETPASPHTRRQTAAPGANGAPPETPASPHTRRHTAAPGANGAPPETPASPHTRRHTAAPSANGAPYPSPGQRPGSTALNTAKGLKARPKIPSPLQKSCPEETQPDFLTPQLALETTAPPATGDWLHELKLDGYRVQARKAGEDVKLLTRKGLDWTHRMPAVARAVARISADTATLDGEVVVLGPDGNSNFADLQASFQNDAAHPLTYFAFDLLHLDGRDPRGLSLRERKQLLAGILPNDAEALRISEHIEGTGESVFHHACELHAEGIISKRADSLYRGTRSGDWLKSKCLREQEFVVAGYTLSTEGDDRIGSLLLSYYEGKQLIYAGRTGTGFTQKLKRDLLGQLKPLKLEKSACTRVPSEARRGAVWTEPKLVAQVRFATWTADNLVRQAAFLGLREDKPAAEVTREEASVAPKPKQHAAHRATPTAQAAKTAAAKPPVPPIRLTHPDKVLDPESGLTKRQLADFYAAVAPHILPHIANRPLSLVRCPEGAGKPCFFQKHVNAMLPKGIGSVDVPDKKTGKPELYITLDNEEAFVGLAQMGVLEIHPWGSCNDDLEHPDRLILDLDPDESLPWTTLCDAAADVRKRLKKAGLESFLKLTGGKGLHIVAPIDATLSWTELKEAAHRFVLTMERANPSLYLSRMSKAARKGKIYLDYLRNERGATAVAPFSPRARAGAHVSLPLPWSALKQAARPVYPVYDFADWQQVLRSDPWKAMLSTRQRLDPEKFHTP